MNDCGDFTDELSCAATPIYQITNSGGMTTFLLVFEAD